MVSIIVPTYNVAPYIDRCIRSIVNQTFSDIEILIIEGESTDETLKKCIEWKSKDSRIQVYSEKDAGLGDARNKGLEIAKGEYIVFVDSDDWIPSEAIQVLYSEMVNEEADIVCGSYSTVNYYTNEEHRIDLGTKKRVIEGDEKQTFLYNSFPTAWAKMYRKALWVDNNIMTPHMRHEDCAVYPLLVAYAKRIVYTNDIVYHYLEMRQDGLKNNIGNRAQMPKALQYVIDEFKRRQLYDDYKISLFLYVKKYILGSLEEAKNDAKGEAYIKIIEQPHLAFLDSNYPGWNDSNDAIAFGSFNLRWIIHKAFGKKDKLIGHYCFTNLIAQTHKGCKDIQVSHINEQRRKWVQSDICGDFFDVIQKKEGKDTLLFIDFLDSLSDLYITNDGNVFTKSEAFEESTLQVKDSYDVIKFGTNKYWELWELSCKIFSEKLKNIWEEKKIFVIKTRYAEKYQKEGCLHKYENLEAIKKINEDIARMELCFLKYLPSCSVIEIPEEYLYTQENFGYGVKPCYLSTWSYTQIGNQVNASILKGICK